MSIKTTVADTVYTGLPTGPGLIVQDRAGLLYVTVFDETDGIIIRHRSSHWETWYQGPVQGLQAAPDGNVWTAQSNEIARHPSVRNPIPHTASFLPRSIPGPLLATREGDIWCANCANMRRGDALFEAVTLAPSSWTITPRCDDPFGNIWAIANNGQRQDLAILNRQYPHTWRLIDLPADHSIGPWI